MESVRGVLEGMEESSERMRWASVQEVGGMSCGFATPRRVEVAVRERVRDFICGWKVGGRGQIGCLVVVEGESSLLVSSGLEAGDEGHDIEDGAEDENDEVEIDASRLLVGGT